jgi:hypothetical protein
MNSINTATRPVAEIFKAGFAEYEKKFGNLPVEYYKIVNAIMICRTEELGGHIYRCSECNHELTLYNSCRNRHCPTCQSFASAAWVQKRIDELLPVSYFHVVFTVPHQLNPFFLRNKKQCYPLFFQAVSETLRELALDPKRIGGIIGFIAILHTWGQTLEDHYHIHCIVPGGALDEKNKKWIATKKDFFLPIQVMRKMFRGKFLHYFFQAVEKGDIGLHGNLRRYLETGEMKKLRNQLYDTEWVVYAKPPFTSPKQVVKYLGNYTHRIAITNKRIVKFENGMVTFRYKDYHDSNTVKTMTLTQVEFIRRFMLHIVPEGFMRIRHYGFLSNRNQHKLLPIIRELIGNDENSLSVDISDKKHWYEIIEELTGTDPTICPVCKKGKLIKWKEIKPKRHYQMVA